MQRSCQFKLLVRKFSIIKFIYCLKTIRKVISVDISPFDCLTFHKDMFKNLKKSIFTSYNSNVSFSKPSIICSKFRQLSIMYMSISAVDTTWQIVTRQLKQTFLMKNPRRSMKRRGSFVMLRLISK